MCLKFSWWTVEFQKCAEKDMILLPDLAFSKLPQLVSELTSVELLITIKNKITYNTFMLLIFLNQKIIVPKHMIAKCNCSQRSMDICKFSLLLFRLLNDLQTLAQFICDHFFKKSNKHTLLTYKSHVNYFVLCTV